MTSSSKTKIILCTVPIRPVPTMYPPIACTSLMEELRADGYDPFFYDIDALRPSFEDVVATFAKEQPDLLLISAVVSTAYRYVKTLTHKVREVSPRTRIILGGNLAASAEILLRKCPIDVCAIGEGEIVIHSLMKHWEQNRSFAPSVTLSKIKGISFLNAEKQFVFTGYEAALPKANLKQPNYEILAQYSDLNRFIFDWRVNTMFVRDPRSHEPHRKDQKLTTLMTAKGCVSRCTFCHRWDKGYRTLEVDSIVKHVTFLKEKYNVGFFDFGDENSLSDPSQVEALVEALRPLDVLFKVGGIRVTTVHKRPDLIKKLKDVGCVAMIFGMESGSRKMLSVMEKGASREQNIEVMRLLKAEDMFTIVQLVVGMPGENEETIEETLDFVKTVTEDLDDVPYERLSVNYFQALPGTPGYEFAREKGLIGKSLDDEEAYLLKISDVDASAWEHYQNVTESTVDRVRLWGPTIIREATMHYYRCRGWKPLQNSEKVQRGRVTDYVRGGYFRILKPSHGSSPRYWQFYSALRPLIKPVQLFKSRVAMYGWGNAVLLTLGLKAPEDRSRFLVPDKSLRKVVVHPEPETVSLSEANMLPLRMGR